VDKNSIALALESLKQATSLRPDIRTLTLPYINNLEDGIEYLKRSAARQKLQTEITRTFNPPPKAPEPELGMTSAQIQILLGEPTSRTRLNASAGQFYEMWIYSYKNGSDRQIYFDNDKMIRIETVPAPGTATETEE
ncbi:MAG: hypothetical protein V1715_11260, partial [bacterium]